MSGVSQSLVAMRLNSAFISIFLFVSAVLSSTLQEKGQPWFPNRVMVESTNGTYENPVFSGAFWEETDGDFTFATATFNTIPLSGQHGYTLWVGIDGMRSCQNDVWFSAGINTFVTDNSETSYTVWYEWGTDGPYYSNVAVTPGGAIRASLNVLSPTSGAVIIENLNTGQSNIHYLPVNSTWSICGRDVSWGVWPYHSNESVTFDTVTITNAIAYGPSGIIYEAEWANTTLLKQDDKAVTSVETKGSTITIHRVDA